MSDLEFLVGLLAVLLPALFAAAGMIGSWIWPEFFSKPVNCPLLWPKPVACDTDRRWQERVADIAAPTRPNEGVSQVISSILALPPVQLHGLVTRGIPASQARILTKVFQLSVAEQKRILGLARRRGKSLGAFTEYQGDCLYRLLTLCQYAVHTLGSEQAAMKWLRSSHVALEGAKPIDMVASSAGTGAALKILGRPIPR